MGMREPAEATTNEPSPKNPYC